MNVGIEKERWWSLWEENCKDVRKTFRKERRECENQKRNFENFRECFDGGRRWKRGEGGKRVFEGVERWLGGRWWWWREGRRGECWRFCERFSEGDEGGNGEELVGESPVKVGRRGEGEEGGKAAQMFSLSLEINCFLRFLLGFSREWGEVVGGVLKEEMVKGLEGLEEERGGVRKLNEKMKEEREGLKARVGEEVKLREERVEKEKKRIREELERKKEEEARRRRRKQGGRKRKWQERRRRLGRGRRRG